MSNGGTQLSSLLYIDHGYRINVFSSFFVFTARMVIEGDIFLTFLCKEEYRGMKTNFVSINNIRFRRKIVPGDVLRTEARLDSFKRGIATGAAESFVDDEPACCADFVVSVPAILDQFKPKA